ncbi:MAG: TRAP transporter substrate-binding protein [Desulfovibrionaceae bacterium]
MKRLILAATALLLAVALVACGGESETKKPEAQKAEPAAAPAPAPAPEKIELTYANFPPAFTVPCVQMEHFKAEVEKRTGGQVSIATFPGGTLLGSKNMLRGVIEGQADIGCLSMSYQPGVFPLTTAVEMPVGFSSSKVGSMVLWDLYSAYRPAEFKDVRVLTMFTTPPSDIMSKTPVRSLAELKGLELRASGTPATFLELLGAAPVSMPMPETPDALQKNLVKGLFSSLEVMQDLKFAELCKNVTFTDGPVYIFAVIMNKAKYEALPADVKKLFDDMGPEQALWTGQYWDSHVKEAMDWSMADQGVQTWTLTKSDRDAIAGLTAGIIDTWKAQATAAGLPADEILQKMLDLKARTEAQFGK